MSSRSARRSWLVIGAYFLLTLALTWPLARYLGSAIPGDSFDGWQNFWNLWWIKVALLEQHASPYFTNLLYHPTGVSLWFQTLNIFNGITFLPVQLAGNLFWAYNTVALFSFTAAGFGGYLLGLDALRRAGARPGPGLRWGAFLTGVVFTFSPFHFAHLLGHMQVFSLAFIPFFALYLLRALETGPETGARGPIPRSPGQTTNRLRNSLLAALFLILAALCDWYFALYLGFFTLVVLLWLLIRRRLRWRHLLATAIIFGLTLLATAPLLAPMVIESLRYDFMKPPPGQIVELSGDVLGFLIPSGQHSLWGDWAAGLRAPLSASPSENTIYLGIVALILAGIGLWRWRGRLGLWLLAAVTFAIFALGPILHVYGHLTGIPLPYALILKLPFVDIARTVARYDLLVMLSLGVLAGGGLAGIIESVARRENTSSVNGMTVDGGQRTGSPQRPPVSGLRSASTRWATIVGLALVALVLLDFAPIPYPISPPDTPDFYHALAADERSGGVMNLPMNWDRPGYLLYQTVHGKPLTAGYISRTDPRALPGRVPVINRFRLLAEDINSVADPAAWAPTMFEFMDIRWVILDRYKMPPGPTRDFNESLTHDIFGDAAPVYEDDRLTVYETSPPTKRLPFVEIGWDFGPLEPGPARSVADAATIVLHVPHPGDYLLTIVPIGDAAPSWRLTDADGGEVMTGAGATRSVSIPLNGLTQTLTLRALGPGLKIHRIILTPSP
jgi:hypothetical protein